MSSVIFQIQSALILSLLFYGVYHRKNRFKHIKTMKAAIIWDLLLIVQIELSRSAIATASKAMANPAILNIHISLALTTVLLYGVIFYTGHKLKNGQESIRQKHKFLGLSALTFRILTFITSFMIEV